MKISERLQSVARLFLDTAPIVYYVEKNPRYLVKVQEIFRQIDVGTLTAVTSPVTLAECLVSPIRLGLTTLRQDFLDLIHGGSNTVFVPFGADTARLAAELRVRYNLSLPDAFQVAAAMEGGCDAFLTNDMMLKRVTELNVIVLEEVESA
jgi:predicted nucleic acid-binding protein